MKIPRTARANRSLDDDWWNEAPEISTTVHEGDYPAYSCVLGPDGNPLEYEARTPLGFDTRPRR